MILYFPHSNFRIHSLDRVDRAQKIAGILFLPLLPQSMRIDNPNGILDHAFPPSHK